MFILLGKSDYCSENPLKHWLLVYSQVLWTSADEWCATGQILHKNWKWPSIKESWLLSNGPIFNANVLIEFLSLMCPAKKSPWGPHWTSGREGSISPTLSGAWHAGTFLYIQVYEYFFRKISIHMLHLQLFCLSAFCWCSDLGVYTHTHVCIPMVQYKQELFAVICNSLKCLGLLSEAAVAERLWPHSLGSAVAISQCSASESGFHWALCRVSLAQVTDHLFNWTLDRFDLFCHQSRSSAAAVR